MHTPKRKRKTRECAGCRAQLNVATKKCRVCGAAVAPSTTKRAKYQRKLRLEKKRREKEETPDKCLICLSPPDYSEFSVFTNCQCTVVKFIGCRRCLEQYIQYQVRPENRVYRRVPARNPDGSYVINQDGSMRFGVHMTSIVKCLVCNQEARPRSAKVDAKGNLIPIAERYLRRLSPHLQRKVGYTRYD